MKFSVCIDALRAGKPSAEAIRDAHEAGAGAFEFWTWSDKDIDDTIRAAKDELGMKVTSLLLEPLNIKVDHEGYFLSRTDEAIAIIHLESPEGDR